MRSLLALLTSALLPLTTLASDSTRYNPRGTSPLTTLTLTTQVNRLLFLKGPVRELGIKRLIKDFQALVEQSHDPIYLLIDSPGGEVDAGMDLVNVIQSTKQVKGVRTICIVQNRAYSMAAILATFCHQTYMLRGSGIMFHEASYSLQGSTSQNLSRVIFMSQTIAELDRKVASQIGISSKLYESLILREWWLTAEAAARQGLVDGVMNSFYYTAPKDLADSIEILFGQFNWNLWKSLKN